MPTRECIIRPGENKWKMETILKTYTEETKGWHNTTEDFYEEEPVILERQAKAALEILGRNNQG